MGLGSVTPPMHGRGARPLLPMRLAAACTTRCGAGAPCMHDTVVDVVGYSDPDASAFYHAWKRKKDIQGEVS